MSTVIPPEEERFAKNVLVMADALTDGLQQLNAAGFASIDPLKFNFAKTVLLAFDKHQLIQGFIQRSHFECWDKIKGRDENFFIENASSIFGELPVNDVNLFRDLFLATDIQGNKIIKDSLKSQLWTLFDSMVKISIKYVHRHRNPYSFTQGDSVMTGYRKKFCENINLAHHANVWELKLEFPVEY